MLEKEIVAIFIVNYAFEIFVKLRQLERIITCKEKRHLNEEEFKATNSYNKHKILFSIVAVTMNCGLEIAIVYYNFLDRLLGSFNLKSKLMNETLLLLVFIVLNELFEVPFSLFSQLVIEEYHGFNTSTVRLFFIDFVKSTVINAATITPAIFCLLYVMQTYRLFYIYAFSILVPFQIIMIIIYPDYIQPLFNTFKQLEEGDLKNEIQKLSERLNFKLSKIFVMDGKTRSHHSNAYFTGLFSDKKIVIYDTLLEDLDDRQTIAVLGHEFGHCKLHHIPKRLGAIILAEFFYLLMFNMCMLRCSFMPSILKLLFFMNLTKCVAIPLQFMNSYFSRKHEMEADRYAVAQGYGKDLGTALVKLHKDNKGLLHVDRLYSSFYYSHPTLFERLDFIENEMKRKE